MGLFNRKKEGGLMDVIRCDEQEYLVWKWRPKGQAANNSNKENAIRYGSSLRVKDGEMAVFLYQQEDGAVEDFIMGPYDDTIKTDNFPVLTGIVGTAFGGAAPFQAEVYFINLAENVQMKFVVPYFDVFDPRFLDFAIPFAVRGTITFNITDYKGFIKLNRIRDFDMENFKQQISDVVSKYVKSVVTNFPQAKSIPVLQLERHILEVNELITSYLKSRLENDFGVNLKALDIAAIDADKESVGYEELRKVTADQLSKTITAQADTNIKNMQDAQTINAQNMQETLNIQREEAQRAQRLQTESNFMGAHSLDQQTEVLKTGAASLGQMGNMGGTGSEGGNMNSAGVVAGMMMGGALGGQMAGMMNNVGQQMTQQQQQTVTPPPIPQAVYHVAVNGQTTGPFNMQQLQQLVQNGQLTRETYVWTSGMTAWKFAGNIKELSHLFGSIPPPPPMP